MGLLSHHGTECSDYGRKNSIICQYVIFLLVVMQITFWQILELCFELGFQVPLDGFKALQGISGPQKFQIHKAYGAPDRLPSAHTW